MKKLGLIAAFAAATAMITAMAPFGGVFNSTYKVGANSKLKKAACGLCHATAKGGKLNPYGADIEKCMKAANTKKMTADILKKCEGMDSDKDGKSNIDEIKADSLPGSK